jgi:surface antigen
MRLRTLLVTVGLVLAGVVGMACPASADTSICSGYANCNASGHIDHGYGTHSGTLYWTMYSGHNCTNYTAYVEQTVNGVAQPQPYNLGSAGTWDDYAAMDGYAVNGTPVAGNVAQWDTGHVAYVEGVTKNGDGSTQSITVSEDDYLGDFHWRVITPSGDWPDHFIHFKNLTSDDAGSPASTVDQLLTVRSTNWNADDADDVGVLRNTTYNLNYDHDGDTDHQFSFGSTSKSYDVLVGDWDGNGTSDIGLREKGTNTFYLDYDGNGTADVTFAYGQSTDQIMVGDWNGDEKDTIGLHRGNMFYLNNNNDGTADYSFAFGSGATSYTTLIGDWNGDGTDDVSLHTSNMFYFNTDKSGTTNSQFSFGSPSATYGVLIGDWDGNGTSDIGLRNGTTYYLNTDHAGTTNATFAFGHVGTVYATLVGDWDGNGTDSIGLREGGTNIFSLDYNNDGTTDAAFTYGRSTDIVLGRL